MLADSIEGSSRARFTKEDASPEKISKLIDEIFDEKINDNQLIDAPLTLQEIKMIRESFQESLEGLYHQRAVSYTHLTLPTKA